MAPRIGLGTGPEFLGWEGPLLERAAEALIARIDDPFGLAHQLVVVPGARAGRTLLSCLSEAARERGWSGFFPPRVLTQGRLVDELVTLEAPAADRVTRTLAWERALGQVDGDVLRSLLVQLPDPADRAAWWRVADDVRGLHAELAVEGYDFAAVRERLGADGAVPASELRRWEALAAVQSLWRSELAGLGVVDPDEGRFAALDAGRMDRGATVVLVGIAEVSGLLRRALESLDESPRTLVFAPEEEAGAFDRFGGLRVEAWCERDVPLALERWRVVRTPDEVARMACAVAADWDGLEAASDLSIGVADDEVVPYLVRRLASQGIAAREAAGTAYGLTAPARLLAELRTFLESHSSASLAALVRHADLERALRELCGFDPVERLDAYRPEHLPRRLDVSEPDVPDAAGSRRDIEPLLEAIQGLFGPLVNGASRSFARFCDDLREALRGVYGEHPLLASGATDAGGEAPEEARVLRLALEATLDAIATLESAPRSLGGEVTPASGVGLVLRIAEAEAVIPPPPKVGDQPEVELLGWLELLLDPASHMVVTGFNEGAVPASAEGDSFLPDRVRTALGLEDDRRRVARDVYVATALLRSRGARIAFISGRETRDGDPTFPSRLAFFRPPSEAGERVDHALAAEAFGVIERESAEAEVEFPPYVLAREAPDTFAVTSFKAYLESPAMFHIRRILSAESVDDRVGEMDPRTFGTFTHEVLEEFATKGPATSTDAGEVLRFLESTVTRLRQRYFPEEVLPAVPLQLEQLKLRLASFATWQAKTAAEGWRIRHVEWRPNADGADTNVRRDCVALEIEDGATAWIRGSIDRIDQHEDGRWRVLDYKTSHKGADPMKVHLGRSKKGGPYE
ncbi:MAG: PD-(D/E)XK nuclease family protein, partial [Planctomycetota bacterium]